MKKITLWIYLQCFALQLLVITNALATNYYVDPSSPTTITNGSITNPWKTIAQVNSGTTSLNPGDSVFFKRGQSFNGRLNITSSGTALNPIVYTTYGTGNYPEFTHTTTDVITIYSKAYIVIDGFKIIDKTMSTTDHSITAKISYAIVLDNSPNCTIQNCEITLVGIGIAVREGSDFTKINNNNIYNLRAVRNTIGGNDDYGANAMVVGTSSNMIFNNRFEGCWATSYDYGYDGGTIEFFGTTISDNKILYNTAINCNGFMEIGSGNYGISTNNLIAYNKILNCGEVIGIHNKQNGFSIRADNLKIFNNVIVETRKQFAPFSAIFWFADPTKIDVIILRNNIIWLTTGANLANNNLDTLKLVHSNNIFNVTGGGILGIKPGATELVLANQQIFISASGEPETWDFRPVSGSPAINFGTNLGLTRDFIGNSIVGNPDAGIFESVSTRATKYYVDPSSTSIITDGSFASPWKTIEQVNSGTSGLQPGDSVFFKRGQTFTGTLLVGGSGTAAKPIVYTAYGTGEMPELTNIASGIITISNKQYVIIDGLELTDKTMSLTDHAIPAKISYGIVLENSKHCTIQNCEISLLGIGITTLDGSDSTQIVGNNIYNMRAVKNTIGGTDDYGANAIVIGSSANIIRNNRFEGCWANSYDYGFSGGAIQLFNSTINNNTILYNAAINCKGFLEVGSSSGGTAINNLIGYNKIINCGQTAAFHNKINGSFINTSNTQFYNNVIIETKTQFSPANSMFWYADPTIVDVVIMKNNIIWITTGENVVSNNLDTLKMVHTNNIYRLRGGGTLGINLDPTELSDGPEQLFTDTVGDPEVWDYRLLPNSPGINFGTSVGLTRDFIGNNITGNPDAGIYEMAFTPPPRSPRNFYADPSSTSAITDGSITNPWKTISQVNNGTTTLVPGDSVFFKRGQTFTGKLIVGGSGTMNQPIVYTSYGIGSLPEFTHTTSDIIGIYNRRYVVIDGFKLTDKTMNATDHSIQAKISYGIVLENSPNCIIRNNNISLVGVGIATREGSDFTLINGNTIYNLRSVKNTVGGTDDYGANALVLGSSSNSITNNRFEDCWATSYDYGFSGGAIQLFNTNVNNNRIQYNTAINSKGFLEIGGAGNGTAINNLIDYNKIINCGQTGIFHNNSNGFTTTINNTRIFNNVIVETKKQFTPVGTMFWYADPKIADIVLLRNNIIWLTTGQNVVSNSLDTLNMIHTNNIYRLRGGGTLGINLDPSELSDGPAQLFTDTTGSPENWDYRLLVGSPAIDFGANVELTRDFIGNPIINKPDAGIYEKQEIITIPPLVAKALAGNINCNGGVVSIAVSATGGVPPYTGTGTYVVAAGTYSYIVTDANNGRDTVTITVNEPAKLNLNLSAGVVNSLTDTTRITAIGSGGKNPLSYQLDTGVFQSSGIFYGIKPGTYNITLKDSNTCTISKSIQIIVTPLPLIAKAQATNISCFGGTATVTVSATGGTSPYSGTGTYTVPAGTYNYIVTDAVGLKDTATITITEPSKLTLNVSAGTVPTIYDTTKIVASAFGGKSPYSYKLNDGLYQQSGTFYGNYAGVYTITVKDANGCTSSQTVKIIVTGLPPLPDKKFRIVVYPNPTSTYFTLETIKYRGGPLPIKIRIFNAASILVYSMQGMTDVKYTFGGNFPPGTYTLIAEVSNSIQGLTLFKQ